MDHGGSQARPGAHRPARTTRRALPGFGLTLGLTLAWLSAIVLLPLAALAVQPWQGGPATLLHVLTDPRTLAALRLSLGMAVLAAAIDVPLGLLLAWTVVRTRFPGRRVLDAVLDLPFALPTAGRRHRADRPLRPQRLDRRPSWIGGRHQGRLHASSASWWR